MGLLYFQDGKLIAQSGQIKIYEMDGVRYLEQGPGHNLWADSLEIVEYRDQIGIIPKGNCLEIGLGLGIVSNYILDIEKVDHLTTIESNRDIISVYKQLSSNDNRLRHTIIEADIKDILPKLLNKKIRYDFIFFDYYSIIDEDTIKELKTLISITKKLLTDKGVIMGWFDPYTPIEFTNQFYDLLGG